MRRLGGQVHTLGYVPDRSTSAIIERIRSHSQDREPDPAAYADDRKPDPSLSSRTQAS